MTGPLADRTVLITGASRGLGRAMSIAVAAAGADLVVTARSLEALDDTVQTISRFGHSCLPFALDATAGPAAIENLAVAIWQKTGGVDVLINNAGLTLFKPCLETTDEDWMTMINVNLSACYFSCRSFGRRMLARGHGKIVNVASDLGIRGEANWSAYSASKGGVVSLSKSLAWEWAPKVIVNVIAPGPFYTDANRPAFDIPEVLADVERRVPLGRVGDPEAHLGPLAVLLAGPGSDFMTGAIFRVDGGICRS